MSIHEFILNIKRAETPFYARLKRIGRAAMTFRIPIPRSLDPIYRFILWRRHIRWEITEKLSVVFYRYPVMRILCVSIGERLRMEQVPKISGNPRIYIGDDVYLSGLLIILAGRVFPDPEIRIGNRTFIGDGCTISVAKSVEIGDDVLIAASCSIFDYSNHPVDPVRRVAGLQVNPAEVRPVRIGNRAWIGQRATILPGVTIGADAVVGAAAVVTKDVPPGCICVGNPGRILSRKVYDTKPDDLVRADDL